MEITNLKQKQYFIYSVFNKVLQSDMGKTIVRKYTPSLDVQRDFESHMSTSSKGLNESVDYMHMYPLLSMIDHGKVLLNNLFSISMNNLHNEGTPLKEPLPHSVRLTLLQTAFRSVPELRIVETMEEYMSLTNSSSGHVSITYDKYFMMLQNACIRYDKNLKQKPSTISRAVYQHELDDDPSIHDEEDDYLEDHFAPNSIDTPSDDIYNVHNTNLRRTPHVKSLIPRNLMGNQNPTRLYLQNLDTMDLSTSPSIFTTCLVKTSRRC